MRPPRVLAGAAAAALLAGIAGAAAAFPSSAVAGDTTTISIKEAPKRAIFHDDIGPDVGDVVQHAGKLTGSDGAPIAGATVTLQRQPAGEAEWAAIAEDTTNDNGRYVLRTDVVGNALYKVVYDDELGAAIESGEVKLEAMRDFNAVLVEKKRTAVLKGNINPGWGGKAVHWERKKCKSCSWHVVERAKAGDHGAWRFSGSYPPIGDTWYYRATIRGTTDFVDSVSAMLITDRVQGRQPAPRIGTH